MPQTINTTKPNPGINPNLQSIRVWLFPGPPFAYPNPPQPMPTPQAEVPATEARFVVYEGFDARNGNGNSLGRGAIDTGARTAMQVFQATTVEDLLIAAFPAPGPDF